MKYDPDEIFTALVTTGYDWADKQHAFDLLDGVTKSVLSELMLQFDGSMAEREARARASIEFKDHMKSLADAKHKANRAKVKYDSCKALADARRTEQSTRRTEMQHLGG